MTTTETMTDAALILDYELADEVGNPIDLDDETTYAAAIRESLETDAAEGWIRSSRYGRCYARES